MAQSGWRALKGKVMARRGQLDEAVRLASDAVAIAERSDYVHWTAGWLMDLGEVLALARRPTEAAEAVRRALDLYERKGNVMSAGRARAVLAELSDPVSPRG
jgi:Flp pilus assembly protein TadD